MEHLENYIIGHIGEGKSTDRQILIDFTKKYMEGGFFKKEWDIDRKFEKQNSLWRVIKEMRRKGKIIETKRIKHPATHGNVGISTTIFYKLPQGKKN